MKNIGPNNKLVPAIIWLLVIWTVSSVPAKSFPSVKIIGIDKLAHIGEYFILASLTNRWLKARGFSKRKIATTYAVLLAGATIDELHQTYIPNRSVSGWDLLANATGILISLALLFYHYDRSKKPQSQP